MWHELAIALSLVLVVEGILPFISPNLWRNMARQVAQLNDKQLRIMGFMCMLVGVVLLYLLK